MIDDLDLGLLWTSIPPDDGDPVAAALDRGHRRVLVNEDLRDRFDKYPGLLRFSLAHEAGHWDMHADAYKAQSSTLFAPADVLMCRSIDLDMTETMAVRHTAPLPRETQASLFASYLLAPSDLLRQLIPEAGCSGWPIVYSIAEHFGMTATALIVRLERDGLAHLDAKRQPRPGRAPMAGQAQLGF